jgi:rhodanese-related sulfurtransferase
MPRAIGRDELRSLLEHGVQLVEVLPPDEYADEHLPGAINIPLARIDDEAPQRLDLARPVVVYCYDPP